MSKVYIIVHDSAEVLIGMGGKSGRQKLEREGYHLPGGTFDRYQDNDDIDTAKRELREETGISLSQLVAIYQSKKLFNNVTFVVAKVSNVQTLINCRIPPQKKNPYDEPFKHLLALPIFCSYWPRGLWTYSTNFNQKFFTDWFAAGLKEAHNNGWLL